MEFIKVPADGFVGPNGDAPSVLAIPLSVAVSKEEASLASGSSLMPRSAMFCCANMNGTEESCGIISFACAVGWIGCSRVGVWLADWGCELLPSMEWCEATVVCIRHLLSSSWSVPLSMLGILSSSSVLSRFSWWFWCAFCSSSSNFFFCLTFARLNLGLLRLNIEFYLFLNHIWTFVSVRLSWRAICSRCGPCGYCKRKIKYLVALWSIWILLQDCKQTYLALFKLIFKITKLLGTEFWKFKNHY